MLSLYKILFLEARREQTGTELKKLSWKPTKPHTKSIHQQLTWGQVYFTWLPEAIACPEKSANKNVREAGIRNELN